MDWMKFVVTLLQAVPAVVYGVESIAKSAPGTTKKQMALSALGLSNVVANLVDPKHQPIIDAATQLASNAIDNVVAIANATGDFDTVGTAAPDAPAQVPQTALDVMQEARGGDATATFPTPKTPDTTATTAPHADGSSSTGGDHLDNRKPAPGTTHNRPQLFGTVK